MLQAEHLDAGFVLSGFRRWHRVSQHPVRVLELVPKRVLRSIYRGVWLERLPERVPKGAPERGRLSERMPELVSERASELVPGCVSERSPERAPGHVSCMPTPLATQAPDELGLRAPLQWEPPCGGVGLDTALEGKEPGCGAGCGDMPGTEGTTEGQPTQGGGVSSAKAAGYPARRHGDFPLRRGVMFI